MKLKVVKHEPWFANYASPSDYENSGVIPIEPMTAKEVMEKDLASVLTDPNFAADEKLDGERGILQFMQNDSVEGALYKSVHCTRIFSRRISKKTGFYNEKTDSVPHLRGINIPYLEGTILDGEMLIEGGDFKKTSSILNCLPEEAISRQKRFGRIVFHAFDCLYFKGACIEHLPLIERKEKLSAVMRIIARHKIPYIQEIPWFTKILYVDISEIEFKRIYPKTHGILRDALKLFKGCGDVRVPMTKEVYFQWIVATGGEGLMVKDLSAPYEHKRTRAYQKIKKRIYRDVVITGFVPPTKEYTGKFPKDFWEFWEKDGKSYQAHKTESASKLCGKGLIPVTRNWFNKQVGGIEYGVRVTADDIDFLENAEKSFEFRTIKGVGECVVVGVCEGIDDLEREKLSAAPEKFVGKVFEVEGNEMFYDTGKIRHPRFHRWRPDKDGATCYWRDHVNA